jgi:hypothetical protein
VTGSADPVQVAGFLRLLRRSASEIECDVDGASMGTAIPAGSRVRIRLDGGRGALPGDAIGLLLGGETLTVHRLMRRRGDHVLTSGDANYFCDAPQRTSSVLGTVTAVRAAGRDWHAVGARQRTGLLSGIIGGPFDILMAVLFGINPRSAIALKNALIVVLTPFIRMRYPAASPRATSRLTPLRPDPR